MSGICDSGTVSAKFQQGTETFGRRFLRGFRNVGRKVGKPTFFRIWASMNLSM